MNENKKKANIWYGLMKLMLALTAGLFIGGAALGTTQAYASSGQVQVESTVAGAEEQEEDGGTMMLMLMLGGLLVLILFVVVVVVATATSTAGIAGGDEI